MGWLLPALVLLLLPRCAAAQEYDSLTQSAFVRSVRSLLTERQVGSILSKLPPACNILGYDIGDMSGDSLPDLVLATRRANSAKRDVQVSFFLNAGEEFIAAATQTRSYQNEAIEVGVSIEDGRCSVTEKLGDYHWSMQDFSMDHRVFRMIAAWESRRLPAGEGYGSLGFETNEEYRSNRCTELFYRVSDAKQLQRTSYWVLPALPMHLRLPRILTVTAGDSTPAVLQRGSSSWSGADDCSLLLRASYDSAWLFLSAEIFDDRLIAGDSAAVSDRLELWFDCSGRRRVDANGKIRLQPDGQVFGLSILPGDCSAIPPVRSVLRADAARTKLLAQASLQVLRLDYRRILCVVQLPMALFPRGRQAGSVGFSAAYHDIDVPEHPEWVTSAATSDGFASAAPGTFGRLDFLGGDEARFECNDLNLARILHAMTLAGIRH